MDNLQTMASNSEVPQPTKKLTEEELDAGAELVFDYLGELSAQSAFIPRTARDLARMAAGVIGVPDNEAIRYVLRMQKNMRAEDLDAVGYRPH
jgi:hypothetical protein